MQILKDEIEENPPKDDSIPAIIFLDSLRIHKASNIANKLREFYCILYNIKNPNDYPITTIYVRLCLPRV